MISQNKTDSNYKDTKLNVPYFSQHLHVQNADHRPKSCGMTSVYMVLKHFDAKVPSLDELIECGIRDGGYGKSGWIHNYFVNLFCDLGYPCERKENMSDQEIELFRAAVKSDSPVIISVIRRLWDRRDFHMVVLTGIRENANGELEGFFYHDPAGLRGNDGEHLYVPLTAFYSDWRRMAIFPSRGSK